MNLADFISLLGLSSTAKQVEALLQGIGYHGQLKLKKGDYDSYIERPELGIYLVFSDEESVNRPLPQEVKEGELILTNVTARSGEKDNYLRFTGELPLGLQFGLSREDVRKKLGPPTWSNDRLSRDRWHFPNYRLIIGFTKDEKAISDVSLELP